MVSLFTCKPVKIDFNFEPRIILQLLPLVLFVQKLEDFSIEVNIFILLVCKGLISDFIFANTYYRTFIF